jgi:hypothetical protein
MTAIEPTPTVGEAISTLMEGIPQVPLLEPRLMAVGTLLEAVVLDNTRLALLTAQLEADLRAMVLQSVADAREITRLHDVSGSGV